MMYLIPLLTAFAIVYVLIPELRRAALRHDFVDRPNRRKIHAKPVPLSGGVALYTGVLLAMLAFNRNLPLSLAVALGGTILVMTGLMDDRAKAEGREFPVWPRLLVYLAASSVPVWFGIEIEGISRWNGSGMVMFPGWLAWIATALWVFVMINMINFIDGVDGLAAGIILIASLTLFTAALMTNQDDSALLAIILAGACTAFLLYNFHPAKIFMGDSGAVFLGYTIAVVAIEGALKSATVVSVAVSVLALGVPIMDTAFVMTRRLLENRGLHRADRLHTHHSLMKWGLSQTQTVSFLYLVGGVFSLLAVIVLLLFRS